MLTNDNIVYLDSDIQRIIIAKVYTIVWLQLLFTSFFVGLCKLNEDVSDFLLGEWGIGSFLSYKKVKKEDLQLEDCLEIIQYPKEMGKYENKSIEIIIGKFGYCLRYDKKFKKISQDKDKWTKEYCIRIVS